MQLIIYISVYLVYLIFTYVTTLLFKCYICTNYYKYYYKNKNSKY